MITQNTNSINLVELTLPELIKTFKSKFHFLWVTFTVISLLSILYFYQFTFSGDKSITYSISLTEISDKKYPNGNKFSINQIIDSNIIKNAINRLELNNTVTLNDLLSQLDISYSYPKSELLKDYRNQIKKTKITLEEIKQAQLTINELNSNHNYILLSINLNNLDLSPQKAKQLLKTIVKEWSKLHISRGAYRGSLISSIDELPSLEDKDTYSTVKIVNYHLQRTLSSLDQLIEANNKQNYFDTVNDLLGFQNSLEQMTSEFKMISSFAYDNQNSKVHDLKKQTKNTETQYKLLSNVSKLINKDQNIILHNKTELQSKNTNIANEPNTTNGDLIQLYSKLVNQYLKENKLLLELQYKNSIETERLLFEKSHSSRLNSSVFKSFFQQYKQLTQLISDSIDEYNIYFSNVRNHQLYTSNSEPTIVNNTLPSFNLITLLVFSNTLVFFLWFCTCIIITLISSTKKEDTLSS